MTCRPKPQFASSIPVSRRSGPVEHRPSQYLPSRRYSGDLAGQAEDFLIGWGLQKGQDYDREVGRVKVSATEVVPDFVFPPLSLGLEVKLIKTPDRVRKVIDEINADAVAYSTRYQQTASTTSSVVPAVVMV